VADYQCVVGLAKLGATTIAVVTPTPFERALSHHVRLWAIGIGTGRRFGTRGIHLASGGTFYNRYKLPSALG
jgi:hypothetical protein